MTREPAARLRIQGAPNSTITPLKALTYAYLEGRLSKQASCNSKGQPQVECMYDRWSGGLKNRRLRAPLQERLMCLRLSTEVYESLPVVGRRRTW